MLLWKLSTMTVLISLVFKRYCPPYVLLCYIIIKLLITETPTIQYNEIQVIALDYQALQYGGVETVIPMPPSR